jgi:hypothetical protein
MNEEAADPKLTEQYLSDWANAERQAYDWALAESQSRMMEDVLKDPSFSLDF